MIAWSEMPTKTNLKDKPNRQRRGVASSETAREINRDFVLHAIHRHQPVSRADLARLTGLQPSTVSVIIGLLIDEGWVLPGTLGRLPRGRRPTFLTLNDRHVTLAIDLRPGNASLAVVDINGRFLIRETVPLSAHRDSKAEVRQAVMKIAEAARTLQDTFRERSFAGVGVSVSGRVEQKTHHVLFAPNVSWTQVDLHSELHRMGSAPACWWMGEWRAAKTIWRANLDTCRWNTRARYAAAATRAAGRPSHQTVLHFATIGNLRLRPRSAHSRKCWTWRSAETSGRCVRLTRWQPAWRAD